MSRPSPIYNGTCKKFSFASSATKQGVKTYVEECMMTAPPLQTCMSDHA